MSGRTIIIGDIHGCHAEFTALLNRVQPRSDDRVVLLGDLINRGPDSCRVLDIAREVQATILLGNHELRLLEHRRTGGKTKLKETDAATLTQLRPTDWDLLESLPLTLHLPELNVVCVHGGFLPGQPWQSQPAEVVTRIQVIDRAGLPHKRATCPDGVLWADLWSGPPFVVYGHTPRPDIYKLKWSAGIDTSCVAGGHLTAYVLPERRFVQVQAARRYYG
ncbi:metallophosphoesterase [Actomonas aquatica]|uniref:Metallophosphoesterase n=1 Tax=Actomonas aquatica TaxID=2866162 RepID=A0ABZ1C8M1_9BACT|nr:metallophosphoesterase [Opitutus sp. WL0086]WRQ88048.1 metallophosphoesterase [Opitutus sp. WL0086]